MSDGERFVLSQLELILLLSAVDCERFFWQQEVVLPDEKTIRETQLKLISSGLLSAKGDSFEIEPELLNILMCLRDPIAHLALYVVGQSVLQYMYYIGPGLALVEQLPSGAYALESMDVSNFIDHVMQRSEIESATSLMRDFRQQLMESDRTAEDIAAFRNLDTDVLLADQTVFLLECLNKEGERQSWLRGRLNSATAYLELCGRECNVLPMTEEKLQMILRALWRE